MTDALWEKMMSSDSPNLTLFLKKGKTVVTKTLQQDAFLMQKISKVKVFQRLCEHRHKGEMSIAIPKGNPNWGSHRQDRWIPLPHFDLH